MRAHIILSPFRGLPLAASRLPSFSGFASVFGALVFSNYFTVPALLVLPFLLSHSPLAFLLEGALGPLCVISRCFSSRTPLAKLLLPFFLVSRLHAWSSPWSTPVPLHSSRLFVGQVSPLVTRVPFGFLPIPVVPTGCLCCRFCISRSFPVPYCSDFPVLPPFGWHCCMLLSPGFRLPQPF